jgi:glycosyltransferase involved in cell wall biosynthesis
MDIATQKYISVIIPIYNTESYLSRCLKSVCSQTLSDIEIICINDGSTDKSAGIIKKFAEKDKRIKVITQPNKGLSAARNIGLDSCQGDYIFFLDADDYLQPQALEIFYKTACKSNCEVVISSEFTKLKKNPKDRNKPINTDNVAYKICKSPLRDLYKHRYVSAIVWNKLYKRETIMPFRFIEGIYF